MKKLFLTLMTVFALVSCGGSANDSSNGSSDGSSSIDNIYELLKVSEADLNPLYAELQNVQSLNELKAVGEKYEKWNEKYGPIAIKLSSNMTEQELEEAMKSSLVQTDDKFADLYEDILYSYGLSFEEENVYLKLIGITRRTRTIE